MVFGCGSKPMILLVAASSLWACTPVPKTPDVAPLPTAEARPAPRPAVKPPKSARTAEDFDTTSREERVAATRAPQKNGAQKLGTTIASLGDPTDPGFWAKTPLVKAPTRGRLEDPASGKSVLVELRPLDAASGAGSQVSLPAMRALGVSLTGLPELAVYAN